MKRLLAALLALVLFVPYVQASPSSANLILTTGRIDVQQPVEQQSPNFFFYCNGVINPECDPSLWVYNPWPERSSNPCVWDVDDQWSKFGTGVIRKDATITTNVCLVGDEKVVVPGMGFSLGKHPVQILIRAPKNSLTVRLINDLGESWTAIPSVGKSETTWTLCHRDHFQGPYPEIAGSNGGYGVPITFTLSITAGSRDVRDVTGIIQVGGILAGMWSIDCEGWWQ